MPRGKAIRTAIYFNKYKPQRDGKCPISIRVTFNREKKFYDTGKQLLPVDYEKLYSTKPRQDQKQLLAFLTGMEQKAQRCINDLGDAFTFSSFERLFLRNTSVIGTLSAAFTEYIDTMEKHRVGTITSYETARNSFIEFRGKAKISDVDVRFLEEFESWMLEKEMCRDYWIFIYLANGINVKDFCLLKWKNIDGDSLTFVREKTVNTKREVEPIQVIVQPEMRRIMNQWGTKTFDKDNFIFPHLTRLMSPVEIRDRVKLVTRLINENMKKIAPLAGVDKEVTTYSARHSFSTILKNSGAPVAMISQALGHSSMATTQNYLASFESDQLKEATAILTAFK